MEATTKDTTTTAAAIVNNNNHRDEVLINPTTTKDSDTKQTFVSEVSRKKKMRMKEEERIEKLRKDLYEMWIHWGIVTGVNQTHPPIPPFPLIISTNRNIYYQIQVLGGMKKTPQLLNVQYLGGEPWKDSVSKSPILQQLVSNQSNPFHPYISPVTILNQKKNSNGAKQQRNPKTTNIMPDGYWQHLDTVRKELYEFWIHQGITTIQDPMKPPIPPTALLRALNQNGLQHCIQLHGGPQQLSNKLGGVEILRGHWKQLVQKSPILQELVSNQSNSFHPLFSPTSIFTTITTDDENNNNNNTTTFFYKKKKTNHRKKGHRPSGIIANDIEYVRKELYEFWVHQGITDENLIDPMYPPIPPPSLVKALERHDLKDLWGQHGGRIALGEKLGNVQVIDGRSWKRAVNDNPILQAFISNTSNPFCIEYTPTRIIENSYNSDGIDLEALGRKTRKRNNKERKPSGYWRDLQNVKEELVLFWKNLGVTEHLDPDKPPLPSQTFLSVMGRHDLGSAIDKCFDGGRTTLAAKLGHVEIISGYWRDTIKSSKIMQEVVAKNPDKFHPDIAPGGRFRFQGDRVYRKQSPSYSNKAHIVPTTTKHSGFWTDYNKTQVRREIYEFWIHQGMMDIVDSQNPPIPPENMCQICDRTDLSAKLRSIGTLEKRQEILGLQSLPGRWTNALNHSSNILYIWAQNKTNAAKLPPRALKAFQRTAAAAQRQQDWTGEKE